MSGKPTRRSAPMECGFRQENGLSGNYTAQCPRGAQSAQCACAAAIWWAAPRSPTAAGGPITTCGGPAPMTRSARRRVANRCPAPTAWPPGHFRPAPPRGAVGGRPCDPRTESGHPRGSKLVDGSSVPLRRLAGRSRRAPGGAHDDAGVGILPRPLSTAATRHRSAAGAQSHHFERTLQYQRFGQAWRCLAPEGRYSAGAATWWWTIGWAGLDRATLRCNPVRPTQ
jgi:hypothetical protein